MMSLDHSPRPRHLVVLGATGVVGRATVARALDLGWRVDAVARSGGGLARLVDALGSPATLRTHAADVSTQAEQLAMSVQISPETSVVCTVSLAWSPTPLLETDPDVVSSYLTGYLRAHLAAAQAFLPALSPTGTYISVGGGTADFVRLGSAPVSMAQAAQRMLVRGLLKELGADRRIRELMIAAMVEPGPDPDLPVPGHVGAAHVAEQICALVTAASLPSEPVVRIERRG